MASKNRKHIIRVIGGTALALLSTVSASPTMGNPTNGPVLAKILSVQAKPYNSYSGEIEKSGNLFDPKQSVRNYIFENDRHKRDSQYPVSLGTPISYIEVSIAVSAEAKSIHDAPVLELTTRPASKEPARTQRVGLGMFVAGHSGQVLHIPFFLYDEGCIKLSLDVRILNGKQILDERTLMVPFSCGD